MTEFDYEEASSFTDPPDQDRLTFGRRLRHLRRARGLTLAELGARVDRAPSALSMLENGRREPRLSLLNALAEALDVPSEELLRRDPPSRRAQLEIAIEEAQRDPVYRALGLPHGEPGAGTARAREALRGTPLILNGKCLLDPHAIALDVSAGDVGTAPARA